MRQALTSIENVIRDRVRARDEFTKPTSRDAADVFATTLTPSPKARARRRALTSHQKTFKCPFRGCSRAYGSAPSLCAHKRARHPGWKGDDAAARARSVAVARVGERMTSDNDDGVAEDEGGGDEDDEEMETTDECERDDGRKNVEDAAVRLSRKRGAGGLNASSRNTALGAYVEIIAADAHGRMGAAKRGKRRLMRAMRAVRVTLGSADSSAPRRAAAAAAARMYAAMEESIDFERERASRWLDTLDVVSHVVHATKTLGAGATASEEERSACAAALVARDAVRFVAAHEP